MKRKILRALAALLTLLLLTACGGSGGTDSGVSYNESAAASGDYYAYDYEEPMEAEEYYGGSVSYAASRAEAPAPVPVEPEEEPGGAEGLPRKLIKRASLEMETTEFDESSAALSDLVSKLNGYFSDARTGDRGGTRRTAYFTIRVPSRNFERFLDQVGDICHETWRDVDQEDISERYYDTEGRLRTQQTKLTRLQALLEQAQDMDDIITIMSAISETEETIESLQGTLSHYDSQVDYSTIDLSLSEVVRLSNIEVPPETYGMRLMGSFTEGIRDFFGWLGDILAALAYGWLWLALLAAIIIIAVRVSRSEKWQKRRAEKAAAQAEKNAAIRAKWAGTAAQNTQNAPNAQNGQKPAAVINGEPVRDGDGKKEE